MTAAIYNIARGTTNCFAEVFLFNIAVPETQLDVYISTKIFPPAAGSFRDIERLWYRILT